MVNEHACPENVLATIVALAGVESFDALRKRKWYVYRFAAAVLMREDCELSYPRIAHILGYKDHTSIMHALRTWGKHGNVVTLVQSARRMIQSAAA